MHYGYSWLETSASDSRVKIQLIKLNSDNQENKVIIPLVVPRHALTGYRSSIYVAENLEAFKPFRKQSKVILRKPQRWEEHFVPTYICTSGLQAGLLLCKYFVIA